VRAFLLHSRRGRLGLSAALFGVVAGVLLWQAPDLSYVGKAFTAVAWQWVAAAVGLNLVSVVVRALAWHIVLNEALPEAARPRHRHVFSAFCVGLLGNAVIPGRVGEVARIAVISRHLPERSQRWASTLGSVFAHRLFDVLPTIGLVLYVIVSARIPNWALPGVETIVVLGALLLAAGCAVAWRHRRRQFHAPARAGRVRRLLYQTLGGLRIFHSPGPALAAALLQVLGWTTQLLAVYVAFRAFQIHEPVAAAGVVLLAINVAIAFPLWPGSVGLFQAAAALALLGYGVAYEHGFAYGIGLQAIEMSVGVGLGLLFLAREGISFAMLKTIPRVTEGMAGQGEPAPEPPSQIRIMRRVRHVRPRVRAHASERVG
jgi:uncharacterized protein (TIRG00374 family)